MSVTVLTKDMFRACRTREMSPRPLNGRAHYIVIMTNGATRQLRT